MALECDVVDRHDGRRLGQEPGERRRGVPVVEVDDVGSQPLRQRRDGRAECEEAVVVVAPPFAGVGVDIGVRARHAAEFDEVEGPAVAVAVVDEGRTDPVGCGERSAVEGADRWVIAGHDHVDVDATGTELGDESRTGLAEPPDLGHRFVLGGRVQHAHSVPLPSSPRPRSARVHRPSSAWSEGLPDDVLARDRRPSAGDGSASRRSAGRAEIRQTITFSSATKIVGATSRRRHSRPVTMGR